MAALTETVPIPAPDEMIADGAYWLYAMIWCDATYPPTTTADTNNYWSGGFHNPMALKLDVYNHDFAITKDELPADFNALPM
jgi:mannan endo-1,4-beta-mannosidase